MTRRALVLGCGGTLGFAWSAGVLAEVERMLGWDARTAEVIIGTSAGAEMAALLGSGISTAEIVSALHGDPADPRLVRHLGHHPGMRPPVPGAALPGLGLVGAARRREIDLLAGSAGLLPKGRGKAAWLREFGASLAQERGWVAHPIFWLMAADVRTGERVAFGSRKAPAAALGDAIAASWAIPGWFPPVAIDGRRYFDGGTVSPTSADLLLRTGVEEAVVVAPMSTEGGAPARGAFSRVERVMRRAMTKRVDAEVAELREAGISVLRIEPQLEELAVMGANFMDVRRRRSVVETCQPMVAARLEAEVREGILL